MSVFLCLRRMPRAKFSEPRQTTYWKKLLGACTGQNAGRGVQHFFPRRPAAAHVDCARFFLARVPKRRETRRAQRRRGENMSKETFLLIDALVAIIALI